MRGQLCPQSTGRAHSCVRPAAQLQQLAAQLRTSGRPCQPFRNAQLLRREPEVAAAASSVEQSGSTLSSNSSLLGPSLDVGPAPTSTASSADALDAVILQSEVGFDYTPLRDALKAGEFEKADDITRAALITLAGEGAQKRNWVYFTEVKFIAAADLTTLDELWAAASGGKFGYRAQREVWVQNQRQWARFFKAINWVQGENNNYRKWPMEFTYDTSAPKGHLPLTNALRGTRLFEAILEHPAFEAKKDSGGSSAAPDWLK